MDNVTQGVEKHRNIELKAKVNGEDAFNHCVTIAEQLTGNKATVLTQKDVFFNSTSGRLKLRYQTETHSELIGYFRPDASGPKLSSYSKMKIEEPEELEKILSETVGVLGRVNKKRLLFLHGQTRIHLDVVESLGHFFELEVVLTPDQTVEEGKVVVEEMKHTFQISDDDLISGAYMDLLK